MKNLELQSLTAASLASIIKDGPGPQYDMWGNVRGKHKLGSQWSHDADARKKRNKVAKKSRAKNRK